MLGVRVSQEGGVVFQQAYCELRVALSFALERVVGRDQCLDAGVHSLVVFDYVMKLICLEHVCAATVDVFATLVYFGEV